MNVVQWDLIPSGCWMSCCCALSLFYLKEQSLEHDNLVCKEKLEAGNVQCCRKPSFLRPEGRFRRLIAEGLTPEEKLEAESLWRGQSCIGAAPSTGRWRGSASLFVLHRRIALSKKVAADCPSPSI